MTRYSSQKADEIPDRDSDNAKRRTRPADQGPPSPKAVSNIYSKGRETVSRKDWLAPDHQANQFPEDKHQDNGRGRYHNDVPLKGDRAWLRGGGEGHRPNMDTGKYDISNVPQRPPGPRNPASGRDRHQSPFSGATAKATGKDFKMAKELDDEVMQTGLKQIQAQRIRAQAEYAEAEAYGNTDAALAAAQEMAVCDDAAQRLVKLHQRSIAQPQQPQTDSEFMAKAPERMDYGDVYRMASKSKYGAPDDAAFRAGIAEVQRRRGRGE